MSDLDDESGTYGPSDAPDQASDERPGTSKEDSPEAHKPAGKAEGGSQRSATRGAAAEVETQPDKVEAEDKVEGLEAELKQVQAKLDQAKKDKAAGDARKKVQDTIANQRATTVLVINDSIQAAADWQVDIDKAVDEPTRADLEKRIGNADQEVHDAEAIFRAQTDAVPNAEAAQKAAIEALDVVQKTYADKQKELTDLPGKIKASQGEIEKLRIAVKSAVDSGQWTMAFYKNLRLKAAIADASALTEAAKETGIVNELAGFEGDTGKLAKAQSALDGAKTAVSKAKADLKAAEQEFKDKQAGLEAAIGNFL
jgi:chromosome segregation ATPase